MVRIRNDERQPAGLNDFDYQLKNVKYEASIEVERTAIEDDEIGMATIRIQSLAESAKRFYAEQAIKTAVAGTTGICYDGVAFFSASHEEGDSGTQDNLTTSDLTSAALSTGRATMMRYKDDKGNPMGILADTIVVGPELEDTAIELAQSPYVDRYTASGTDQKPTMNVQMGRYKVMVSPWITDTDSWYLLATNRVIKPFVYQNREPTTFAALDNPNASDSVFMKDKLMYGVSNRFNMGYGDWRMAIANIPD